jgi:hypothetical protein
VWSCSDPALTYLNELGYNVIRLPRAGIEPLDVLGRDDGPLERLGRIDQIWRGSAALPAVHPPADAAQVNGQKTHRIKLSIGLKLLGDLLGSLSGGVPSIDFAYKNARALRFAFSGVTVTTVDPLDIGHFLAAGDVEVGNPFVQYFDSEARSAYVLTEVLKSDSITVIAEASDEQGVEIDVPAVQDAVKGKLSVSTAASRRTEVTFKGKPVAFGFKAFGIGYADGNWVIHGFPSPGPDMVLAAHDGDVGPPVIFARGRPISLSDQPVAT